MKKSILLGISALSVMSMLVSCHDELGVGAASGSGFITPSVDLDKNVSTSRSADEASRASDDAVKVTVSDLALRLTAQNFDGVWNWASVAEFDKTKEFKVGNYLFEAYYGDKEEEGFNKPAYYGSQTIAVEDGKTTPVALTASLSNAMFTIKYTEAFKGYMADWSATVNGIDYAQDEERPVYVTPGEVQIKVSVTKPNGVGGEFTLDPVTAKARTHYTMTVDVNGGNVGDATLKITFDEQLQEDEIEIDLSDKLLLTPAPTVTPKGFVSGEAFDILAGATPDNDLTMDVLARAKMKEVKLKTQSVSLLKQGWPEEVDLMTAGQQLKSFGFDAFGLWNNPDQMAQLDFTAVTKHINFETGEDNNVTFTVTVKDNLMRESEPVVLALNIETVQLQLASAGTFYYPGEPLDVVLSYNGKDVKENVTFEYFHRHAGVWNPIEIEKVSQPSRAMSNFTVTLNVPSINENIKIRALSGGVISNELVVELPPFAVTASETNVFATYAYVQVVGVNGKEAPALSNCEFYVLQPNASEYTKADFTVENDYAKLTNLPSGQNLKVKVKYDGCFSSALDVQTEAATQLPNSNLDTWYSVKGSNYWSTDYPGADENTEWGTMNLLTTSEGSTSSGLASAAGYAAKSGTTSEQRDGGFAALIQTVGWGKGNTAWLGRVNGTSGSLSGGACQHFTPGELYLGYYDESSQSAVYSGLPFASRPSSLTFSYKYAPYNSADWAVAEVYVLDRDGKELSKYTVNITKQDDYTTMTMPLTYAFGCNKAAVIKVMFKSSGNSDCWAINNNNMSSPPSANTTTSVGYIGAKLYVDDIQLNY